MKLLLARSNNIACKLLRLVMGSRWSHSAILDEVLDVVYDSGAFQGGVKVHDFRKWARMYPQFEVRPLMLFEETQARVWITEQFGKKYDWSAIFGIFFRRNWQEEDRWFCSELVEVMRNKFGEPKFRSTAGRITPYHQDIVA